MQLKLTDLFSILHNHSVDDKPIPKHFVFKAKLAFFCLLPHRYTGPQHRQPRRPNTTRKQTGHFKNNKQEMGNKKHSGEEIEQTGSLTQDSKRKWTVAYTGGKQAKGREKWGWNCVSAPKMSPSSNWNFSREQIMEGGKKKRKCYIGFSSFLQHLGLICSSGLVQSA